MQPAPDVQNVRAASSSQLRYSVYFANRWDRDHKFATLLLQDFKRPLVVDRQVGPVQFHMSLKLPTPFTWLVKREAFEQGFWQFWATVVVFAQEKRPLQNPKYFLDADDRVTVEGIIFFDPAEQVPSKHVGPECRQSKHDMLALCIKVPTGLLEPHPEARLKWTTHVQGPNACPPLSDVCSSLWV